MKRCILLAVHPCTQMKSEEKDRWRGMKKVVDGDLYYDEIGFGVEFY